MMIVRVASVRGETDKARNYEIYHPRNLRKGFVWLPISKVKVIAEDQIKVPLWLWKSIKQQLRWT